ncbi:uncharacterized protein A4U43_C08F18800 [Asparagus officinalis]|uniref:pentatricopeptide repeat-containing protein At3g22690 n=1 Tax=Asparagus officinalis TaxID=4686 RepID=UPI00098E05F4|nr:pentatricopeptide repeat-containing protein At3g22690 [Asparagus officinalis]XP_020244112.1 pentatricopeptide repeat-containing protein At3g22690 [Asparagus officinalis]XP_020244113.1 pentatricopeptide repeat-containing protein At3g22690 [Asparagus officinalis]ONK60467.1 uncharacterized protein A4U43_C08F18800 [Asparagus officinalis]
MAATTISPSPSLLSSHAHHHQPSSTHNPTTTISALKLATTIDQIKQTHAHLTRTSPSLSPLLPSLTAAYSKLSTPLGLHYALNSFQLSDAHLGLDPNPALFALNSLIRGFSSLGSVSEAIRLYGSILDRGLVPDRFTFPPLFAGLTKIACFDEGIQFHGVVIKVGIDSDPFTDNSLLRFYAELGDLASAKKVFDGMSERNVVSWTSLIDGYARGGEPRKAVDLFYEMVEENKIMPNSVTMACVVSACAKLQDLEVGERICAYIAESGIGFNTHLVNSLANMYMKCGEVEKAKRLFNECVDRNIVVFNTMVTNFARLGFSNEALSLFHKMLGLGPRPDRVTVVGAASASAQLGQLKFGKQLHGYIIRHGLACWESVSNSVIDMYMKCGDPDAAFRVFELMPNRTEVSWNTIINGCIRNGDFDLACRYFDIMPIRDLFSWNTMINALVQVGWFEEAILLFRAMQRGDVSPDKVTMVSVSSACGYLGALDLAKWVYSYIDKKKIVWNVKLGTALVDMFAKCGDSKSAMKIFNQMPIRDVSAWTAAIGAMAVEGNGKQALVLFNQMITEGVKPDSVAFVGVLTALSHGGFVKEGRQFFHSMTKVYGFSPEVVHYGCMVDLLGRAGLLKEAKIFIKNMTIEPNDVIWGALLAASRIHHNLKLAEYAAKKVIELAPERSGIHVLLSNVYASAGKWEDVARVRLDLKDKGIQKEPGSSLIEIDGEIHEFTSTNESHPQMGSIAKMIDEMGEKLSVSGHVPELANVLLNVDDDEKMFLLSRHSEKIAVAFGLISTSRGAPIHVVKNLRICGDCHEFMKRVSDIYEREITVRDNIRFHHFHQGRCSCNDYW